MLVKEQIAKLRKRFTSENERLILIFDALSDPGRFRIFKLLSDQKQDLCVSDVAHIFDISVSAASQQLKILEMTGLAEKHRDGQKICYKIHSRDPLIESIKKLIK